MTVFTARLSEVEDAIQQVAARLAVIDPIADFFGIAISSQHVNDVLLALEEVAKKHELAVLLIRHLTKGIMPLIGKAAFAVLFIITAVVGIGASLLRPTLVGRQPCRPWFAFYAGVVAACTVFTWWIGSVLNCC